MLSCSLDGATGGYNNKIELWILNYNKLLECVSEKFEKSLKWLNSYMNDQGINTFDAEQRVKDLKY